MSLVPRRQGSDRGRSRAELRQVWVRVAFLLFALLALLFSVERIGKGTTACFYGVAGMAPDGTPAGEPTPSEPPRIEPPRQDL